MVALYVPASQVAHAVPDALYPTLHWHTLTPLTAIMALLAEHDEQADTPPLDTLPDGHAVHETEADASVEYRLMPHASHATASPMLALYVPAPQATHEVPEAR